VLRKISCLTLSRMKLFKCYFRRYMWERREHLDGNPVSIWSIRYDINLAPLLLRARWPLLSPKLYPQSSHFRDWLPHIFYHTVTRPNWTHRLLAKALSYSILRRLRRGYSRYKIHICTVSCALRLFSLCAIIERRDDIEIFPSLWWIAVPNEWLLRV